MTLTVTVEQDGYCIANGERKAGPFRHSGEIDCAETAKFLGCEPKDVLAVSLRISKFGRETERAVAALQAPEESNLSWKEINKLTPAQDLIELSNPGSQLCVTLPLSCMVEKVKKDGGREVEEKILPHVVLSNRRAYIASPEWFASHGISHYSKIELPPKRWSIDSFRAWKQFGVDADKLETYYQLKEQFEHYLDCVEAGMYWHIPLWIMGTYFFSLFETYPIIGLTGTKEAGKSKVLRFTFLTAFNGKWSANMSVSRMFRSSESLRSTICLDEAEGMADPERKQAIRSLLNSSYENGATADLTNKATGEGEEYSTYGPRMLGAIQGFENVLESRSIVYVMLRTSSHKADREIVMRDRRWQEIRDRLYLLMMNHWQEVKAAYERVTTHPEIHGRSWQLWRPMFALAEWLGDPKVKAQIYTLAKRKTGYQKDKDKMEADEIILLQTLKTYVTDGWWKVGDIKDKMLEHYEEPPPYLTSRYVGRLLERLNWTECKRINGHKAYKISAEEVRDRAERYGVLWEDANGEVDT